MNKMLLKFSAKSENEAFARTVVTAFVMPVNPSLDQLNDVKTAVSEAVTNSVVHAYPDVEAGEIEIQCELENNRLHIKITDFGKGIEDIENALEPYFTTRAEDERSGMGFTIMKTFMDELNVITNKGGTIVDMVKYFAKE